MTKHPVRETITFEKTSNVAINDTEIGGDFDNVEGDRTVASNEVFEVERLEVISPPQNADGSIQPVEWIQLHDGDDYYKQLRFRWWMLGGVNPGYGAATPRLGVPVLSGAVDPSSRPLLTATPKFGPDDQVNVALKNTSTEIDDDFAIRVHGWRFKGTDTEMQEYFNARSNLSPSINQSLSVSNPFNNSSASFSQETIEVRPGANGGAHGQFTRLTGGINQNLPKVWPWATWTENANATRTNTDYEFSFARNNVDNKWQELYNDYSNGQAARRFDYVMVQGDVANALEAKLKLESRPAQEIPTWNIEDNDQHELPVVRRLDDNSYSEAGQTQVPIAGSGYNTVEAVHRVPNRLDQDVQKQETMVWDDEGGVAIVDDGTSIPADGIRVGVIGRKMELEG